MQVYLLLGWVNERGFNSIIHDIELFSLSPNEMRATTEVGREQNSDLPEKIQILSNSVI